MSGLNITKNTGYYHSSASFEDLEKEEVDSARRTDMDLESSAMVEKALSMEHIIVTAKVLEVILLRMNRGALPTATPMPLFP